MSDEPRELHLTERMIPMKGGKQYLQVADRIVWFREEYPEGTIETTLVELDRQAGFCMYRARVTTGKGGLAEASGTETSKDFGDYIEKSETKAVGRALGYLGFGTASAGFEEGQRVVDAPQAPRTAPARNAAPAPATPKAAPAAAPPQLAPQTPLPRFTDAELNATIDQAWTNAEDGWALGAIRDDLNRQRHRMTKEQAEATRDALAKIEAKFYVPASNAG